MTGRYAFRGNPEAGESQAPEPPTQSEVTPDSSACGREPASGQEVATGPERPLPTEEQKRLAWAFDIRNEAYCDRVCDELRDHDLYDTRPWD